jgi:ADP-ribose pyrophosphatase YjhB (NUDIX family)
MLTDEEFLERILEKGQIRISARAICMYDEKILVTKNRHSKKTFYAFPGGELEYGEKLSNRLKKEFLEETNSSVKKLKYLFVVENRFKFKDRIIHSLEHYFLCRLEHYEIVSRDPNEDFFWLSLNNLSQYELYPKIVKESLIDGTWKQSRHFIELLE